MVEEHERKLKLIDQEQFHMQMLYERKMQALDAEITASQAKRQHYEQLMQKSRTENGHSPWLAPGHSNYHLSQL